MSYKLSVSVNERQLIKKLLNEKIIDLEYLIEDVGTKEQKSAWKNERNFCKTFLEKVEKGLKHIE